MKSNAYFISVVIPVGKPKQKWDGYKRLHIRGTTCGDVVLK
jgi:hypothetical protein